MQAEHLVMVLSVALVTRELSKTALRVVVLEQLLMVAMLQTIQPLELVVLVVIFLHGLVSR
jgi:hypothetical protein